MADRISRKLNRQRLSLGYQEERGSSLKDVSLGQSVKLILNDQVESIKKNSILEIYQPVVVDESKNIVSVC